MDLEVSRRTQNYYTDITVENLKKMTIHEIQIGIRIANLFQKMFL